MRNSNPFAKVWSLLAIALLLLGSAYAERAAVAQTDFVGPTYSGPVFQDSFWTDGSATTSSLQKKEVGPGDGVSTLVVVVINRGIYDITAITGYLTLPQGFIATGASSSPATAVATYNNIVKAGQSFTLFFDVYVTKQARVGQFSTQMTLNYSHVLEIGSSRSATLTVPFKLPGRVVIDAVAETQQLLPGQSNTAKILLLNRGSNDATGVTATITGISGSISSNSSSLLSAPSASSVPTVNLGQTTFDIGTIPANNGSAEISSIIYPSNSAAGTVQTLALQVAYNDAYGSTKTSNISVGFVVAPSPPESVLSVSPSPSSSSSPASNDISTNNSGSIITAGKIQQLNFTVTNDGNVALDNLILSLASQSDSMKILGDSKWAFKSLDAGASRQLSTAVFAATSLVGNPASFTLTGEYVSGGRDKTTSLNMGVYVDGEISVRAYDVAINYIGSSPSLVGNLLNEGNTLAMFTTIEALPTDGGLINSGNVPPSQYLGDLDQNSPLPFTIPLQLNNSTAPGQYPITLKVTYKDSLRIPHEVILKNTVSFAANQTSATEGASSGPFAGTGSGSAAIAAGVAIAIAIIVFVILWRRRYSNRRLRALAGGDGQDIDPLLDTKTPASSSQSSAASKPGHHDKK